MDVNSLSDDDLIALSNKNYDALSDDGLVFLASQKKRNTTFGEDIGIALNSAAQPFVKASGLLAGGAADILGRDEARDSIYKGMNNVSKSMEDYWNPKNAEQTFGGKLAGAAATLPVQMAGMLFSPAETGKTFIDNGESLDAAQKAALLDTAGNAAGLAINPTGKLLPSIAKGAGYNASQDVLSKLAISSIADKKETQEQFKPTLESAAISGIIGGGFGALGAGGDAQIKVKTGDPYSGKPVDKTPNFDLDNDTVNRKITLQTELKSIEDQLARQKDLNSEYSQSLQMDALKKQNEIIQLEAALGERRDIAPPEVKQLEVDSELTNEYAKAESALQDVELEYRELSKKGAALTGEEKAKLQDLEQQHAVLSDYLEKNVTKVFGEEEPPQKTPTEVLHEKTSQHSFMELNREMTPSWELAEPMRQAFESGGLRAGLAFLASKKGDASLTPYGRYLGELAQKLYDNPLVDASVTFDPKFPHAGGYDNAGGGIIFRDRIDASPAVALHEATHSAVNKALSLFDEGKLTDPRQVMAARNIKNLWNSLRLNKDTMDKIIKVMGEENAKIVMENTREFVAYGMSDQKFQLALQKIKLGDTPVWSKLTNAIKNLLNLNKNERTALDDVLRYGEHLIESSDGAPLGYAPKGGVYSPMKKIHNPQEAWQAIKNGSLKVFAHGFTQNLRQMMRDNPEAAKLFAFVDEADRARESLVRLTTYGKDSFQDWANKGRFFFKLGGAENKDALVPAMHGMDGTDIAKTMDVLMDGYRKGIDIQDTITQNQAGWTPAQTNLANAVAKAVDSLWQAAVKMQGSNSLDPKLKQRMGYVLTSRSGDYATTIKVNGVTVRSEYYMTKAEADHWANWFKQQTAGKQNVEIETALVDNIRSGNATDNLVDFIESLKGLSDAEVSKKLESTLDALTVDNSSIGSHSRQSGIIAGFTGDQAGMTLRERGERWRSALPRAVNEYAQSVMSRDVQKKLIEWHIDNDHKMDGITKELGDFYVKSQIGRPFDEGTLRDLSRQWSNKFKELIDLGFDKTFGFSHRDKHAFDRFMGLFSNAFYTANITMKPAIWIAQPLQALQSGRTAFKNGESPRQVLLAFGKTLTQLAGGKMMADKDFAEALYHVSQDGNILHPQMTNEFNDWHVGTDPNSTINKVINHATGRTISAAGDKFSRYASFVFFYNLHKQSGLKGKELWNTAGRDATENMVAYGNKKLPAIYREMGIVGEQGAPLATFIHTQAGNMIVDVKDFIKQPGARTAAPLIMTAAVSMILGGAISMPVIAEYELLRQAGIAHGWWGKEWPSVSDMILKHAPTWVSHGVLSGTTDIDVDASMRYTSMLQKIADIEKNGVLAFAPHLSWANDVISNAPTAILGALGGDVTNAEMDQALKKVLPKGPVAGTVDAIRHEDNIFTHSGKKGLGTVERDTQSVLAPFFGTRSTKEGMDTQVILTKQQRDKEEKELLSRAAQHYIEGRGNYGNKAMGRLLTKYYNGDRNKLQKALETQIKGENTPLLLREYFGVDGNQTEDQKRQFVRDDIDSYLEKRYSK